MTAEPVRVLVAGVGNIFRGDDGFGCEVVRRLGVRDLPAGVSARDYGVAGVHLAYDLLAGPDLLVLADTVARGAPPGTVHLIEVTDADVGVAGAESGAASVDAHGMDPATVLASLAALGGRLPRTVVVGCEPADTGERMGLSPAVEAAVPVAVAMVTDLLASPVTDGAGR